MIGRVALKNPATLLALGQYGAESYQRVLDYATLQGYALPSPANQVLQKALINSLKAAGIWDKLDVFYNFYTDGPREFAKINWKRPTTFYAQEGGTVAYAIKSGFSNNTGGLGYLATMAPAEGIQMTLLSGSHIWGFTQVGGGLAQHHGLLGATGDGLLKYWGGTYLNGASGGPAPGSTNGFYHSDFSGGNLRLHRNGVSLGTTVGYTVANALSTYKVWVCQRNDTVNGAGPTDTPHIITCFGLGGSLVGLEAAFFTAWNTYVGATLGIDPSYTAILTYAMLQGFVIPSAANQVKQNALIVALKAAGIWDELDVFYNFYTDGSASFAKINWKNPGLYSMPATTWSFTSLSGFTGNTTSVNMGYNPYFGTKYLINDASISIDISGIGPAGGYCPFSVLAAGNPATTPESRIVIYPSNAYGYWYINSIYGLGGLNLPAGFMHTQVHPTGGNKNYLNGVFFANGTGTPSVIPTTTTLHIGGEPFNSAPATGVTFRMLAVGASLFGKELAFYTAWNAYKFGAVMLNPDLSYKPVLDYAVAQQFLLPSVAVQEKQNALVIALKAAGIWTLMDLFYNFYTDGDANFAKINWKNPGTFQLVGTGHEPLFTPLSGFGDGLATSQKYFNTQWIPSLHAVNFTLASSWVSFGEAIPIVQPGGLGAHGANTNSQLLFIVTTSNPASTNQADIRINLNPAQALLNGTDFNGLAGVYQFWRESSTQMGGKKDGNADVLGTSPAAFALPDGPFYIFALNSSGNPGAYASERLDHFAIGAKLTATQRGQFYNAWNTYKT